MSKTTKLTVKTDVGTFSRRTVRTYSHLVAVQGERAEVLEERRLRDMAQAREDIARYTADMAGGCVAAIEQEREHLSNMAAILKTAPEPVDVEKVQARWRGYLASAQRDLAADEARGVITDDAGEWFVLGWCGRGDLAQKLAQTEQADRYRHVRIYTVAGVCVWKSTHAVTSTQVVTAQRNYRRRR